MTTKLDEIRDKLAQKYLIDNDLDYQKYRDKRGDRSAYNSLMNYEITGLAEDVYVAGWDAAMERVRPLVERYEMLLDSVENTLISFDKYGLTCDNDILIKAKEALAKFRGES